MNFNYLNFNIAHTNIKTLDGYAVDNVMNSNPYLTPDALMAYCSSRLRGLDDQVHAAFAQQEKANQDSAVLTKVNINIPDHELDMGNDDDRGTVENAIDQLKAAENNVQDPTAKSALQGEIDTLNGYLSDSNNPKIPIDDFKKDTSDAVQKIQQDINSGAELSMINLQSLMSQRQEAIQLSTNLVQSLGDQANKIAENVGH